MPSTTPRVRRPARRAVLALTAAALVGVVPVATTTPASAAQDHRLQTRLGSVLKDSRAQRAKTGVAVLDGLTGEALYTRYGNRAVMPASNAKITTAVAAMHTLGPDYRFHTDVIRRGSVVDGVLTGRLYLKGYGDPTTRVSDYAALADKVAAAGITKVTGSLVVDGSFFDSQRYNPGWRTSYASDYYAAQTAALTVAPNADLDSGTVFLDYAPAGSSGKRAKITTTPAAALHYVKIVNHTTTSARGTSGSFSAHRTYGTNTITVSGRVPRGRSTGHWQITVNKPELYAGAVFRAELAKDKITVAGSTMIATTPATKRELVARDRSITLSNLLVPFLKLSNNLHAEALTKTMGRAQGRPGNWHDGTAVTLGYLRSLGVPMTGLKLVDGSGVSRSDRMTPRALATTLSAVKKESWWPAFYRALPVAGNTKRMVGGTLRYRMNGTRAANNAHAKTGSLTGVTALSGYVTGADGRQYAYSVLSNYSGSTPRPVENTVVITLAGWRR